MQKKHSASREMVSSNIKTKGSIYESIFKNLANTAIFGSIWVEEVQ